MSAAAKVAMAKGREKTLQARKAKKEAARKRAAVAREARTGKKAPAKSTPKKWEMTGGNHHLGWFVLCYDMAGMKWVLLGWLASSGVADLSFLMAHDTLMQTLSRMEIINGLFF